MSAAHEFRRATSLKNLESIFTNHVAASTTRGRDGQSALAVKTELASTARFVSKRTQAGTYRFTPYRQRLISKGAGKNPRVVSIPTIRDRIALRALSETLTRAFPSSGGRLPQSVVQDVSDALATGSFTGYIRIDVINFFGSIEHARLRATLGSSIRKDSILSIVFRALTTPTVPDNAATPKSRPRSGVPQGLSISNPLAEIYIAEVDALLSSSPSVSYHRFVDDILILCDTDSAEALDRQCRDALTSAGLNSHPARKGGKSEIGALISGFDFLGYTFKPGSISVRASSVVKLETRLASIFSRWASERLERGDDEAEQRLAWHLGLAITGCISQRVAFGWLQYFRQMNDLTVLKKLDHTVDRLARRYGAPATLRRKSFMRAYWAIRHPRVRDGGYVPNFDSFGILEMSRQLELLGFHTAGKSDTEIREAFGRVVRKAVKELERDVGDLS